MKAQGKSAAMGVVLVNLGSPAKPKASAVWQFLARFLSDRRVVELPRLVWLPLLYGVILPLRSHRVAKLYQSIWTTEGSPLLMTLRHQARALQAQCPDMVVSYAVSYGEPSISQAVSQLRATGVETVVVLPLYPQYSGTTTGAVYDQVAKLMASSRYVPDIRVVRQYSDRPDYIAVLAHSIQQHWSAHGRSEKLLFSFHGIPRHCVGKGDPYELQCRQTAADVVAVLGLQPEQWQISFQSRFGKAEWLQPYTDAVLAALPRQGCRTVDVVCPSFSADCLETLEEIEQGSRRLFLSAGGQRFCLVPCLNNMPEHIRMMESIVRDRLVVPAVPLNP